MQELRSVERVRSFLRARIIFNNRMSTIDCVIKNYSPSGAKIALNDSLALPTQFEIDIPQKGRSFHARMVWRDKEAVGVEFIDSKDPVAAPAVQVHSDTPEQRVYELQLQNAELKGKILRLRKRLQDLGQDPDIFE
jgi:PilZ domain